MELETLFSGTRWDILKLLSEAELSPIEIAKLIDTTSANVSQQLRLLELGNLVSSEKTKNIEKGKPRIIYGLNSNLSYLIIAANNYAEKKLLPLSDYHSFVLRTWFLQKEEHHEMLNRFYWEIKPFLRDIEIVAVNTSKKDLEVIVVPKNPDKIKKIIASDDKIKVKIVQYDEFKSEYSKKTEMHVLYDIDSINKK